MTAPGGLVAEVLETSRLVLTPLSPGDAPAMTAVLADPELYRWTGGAPPTVAELTARYRRQTSGPRPDGEQWLTWVLRLPDATPVGYVQATVTSHQACVAWVVGRSQQGRGYAREAVGATVAWLAGRSVPVVTAHIAPGHRASEAVAAAVGLRPTAEHDADGERIWRRNVGATRVSCGAS